MSNDSVNAISSLILKQGEQQIERTRTYANLFSSVVGALVKRGQEQRSIEAQRLVFQHEIDMQNTMVEQKRLEVKHELELKKQEVSLAQIELEKQRINEQRAVIEKMIDVSLEVCKGKQESLNLARTEYTRFYEKQLDEIQSTLQQLYQARDRASLSEYSMLTPQINRLLETKENMVYSYNKLMIELDYRISALGLEIKNISSGNLITNKD